MLAAMALTNLKPFTEPTPGALSLQTSKSWNPGVVGLWTLSDTGHRSLRPSFNGRLCAVAPCASMDYTGSLLLQ